ncbi:MAG: hypothetical protein JW963_19435 [Anaerolineales bacterium]|nr:hypothetical protein [Anaerolineales bacterium]
MLRIKHAAGAVVQGFKKVRNFVTLKERSLQLQGLLFIIKERFGAANAPQRDMNMLLSDFVKPSVVVWFKFSGNLAWYRP